MKPALKLPTPPTVNNSSLVQPQKRATGKNQDSSSLHRDLFASSPDGMALLDYNSGVILDANPRLEKLIEVSKKSLIGKRLWEAAPFKESLTASDFRDLQKNNNRHRKILTLNIKGGGRSYLELASAVYSVERGRAIQCVFRDIPEDRWAESAYFRELIQNSMEGFGILDAKARFVYVSQTGEKLTGYKPKDILGTSLYASIHSDDVPHVQFVFGELLEAHELTKTMEYRFQRKDGVWRHFEATGRNLLHDPSIKGVIVNFRDITERKQAELSLFESEARYRSLFDDSPISLWEEDWSQVKKYCLGLKKTGVQDLWSYFRENPQAADHCMSLIQLVDVNKAGMDFYGAREKREALISLTDMIADESRKVLREEIAAIASGQLYFESEDVAESFGGEKRYVMFRLGVVRGYEESLGKILVSVVDITERKWAEESLYRRSRELEILVAASSALRSMTTVAEIVPAMTREAANAIGASFASIFLVEGETGDLVSTGWYTDQKGSELDSKKTPFRHPFGEGITGHVAKTGRPHYTKDLQTDTLAVILANEKDRLLHVHSGLSLPLRARDQVVGVLHVWVKEVRSFSDDETYLLNAIADIAGNAIHRAKLYEQTLTHTEELSLAYDNTLAGWAHALELRDELTEGHTRRVTELAVLLARRLGVPEADLSQLRRGALLHDIGKMGIPDSILHKPSPLTLREKKIMRLHPQYAYDLLSPIEFLRPALDIPFRHHERWDGSGYPHGLKGEEIPLAARIFSVVDVWDALTSNRPYRPAWSAKKTRNYIKSVSGKFFEPRIVEEFLRIPTEQIMDRFAPDD